MDSLLSESLGKCKNSEVGNLSQYEKDYIKAVCCHPAYFTYMQSTSWETLGWQKHKLKSRFPGEIPIITYADDTTLMAESEE